MKVLAALCLSALTSLAQAQVATKDYFPLDAGAYWIHSGVRTTQFSIESGIYRSDALGGAPSDLVLHSYGPWVSNTLYHFDRSDGATTDLTSATAPQGTYSFSPPKHFLPPTAQAGTTFSSSGACGVVGGYTCTYSSNGTVEGFEHVSVKAGTFSTLRVKYDDRLTLKAGRVTFSWDITDTIWMGLGIGEVKRSIVTRNVLAPDDVQDEQIELVSSNLAPDENNNKQEEDNDCEKFHGDPINLTTGNSRQTATDYAATSRLNFGRVYNSQGATRSSMGTGWRHRFDHRIALFDAQSPRTVIVTRADGRLLNFTEPELRTTQPWLSDPDSRDRLVAQYANDGSNLPKNWLYYPGCARVESYDSTGQLQKVVTPSGQSLKFSYDAGGLTKIADEVSGRGLSISRNDGLGSLITGLTDDSGLAISFQYDPSTADLKTAGVSGRAPVTYAYNEPTRTGGVDLPHALTTLKAEDGKVLSKWTFDSQRRAISSERGSVGAVHSVEYTQPGVSTLRYPNDKTSRVNYQRIQGVSTVTKRELPQLDDAARHEGMFARELDNNRNVRYSDNFNGNRTCFANDQFRNLETVRVEGLKRSVDCDTVTTPGATLPKVSRKISTSWHPDWRLIDKVAEPLKITTYVYNGRTDPFTNKLASCVNPGLTKLPDGKPLAVLCKKVEQATDDSIGALGFDALPKDAPRTWTLNYNDAGQLLSAIDPVLRKTLYSYYTDEDYPDGVAGHSPGDLKLMRNAAGHRTAYDRYDKAGRLLQSTDPNDTVTTRTYEAHGWIETVKVTPAANGGAPQLTRYDYYPTGQLKTVTLPDATKLDFVYDDAQRLTDVTDSAGNAVRYVPDVFGNAGTEETRDPQGQLVRRIERVFNDLNLLQDFKVVAN